MRKRLISVICLLSLAVALGCGMSAGQELNLYLGAVTVQERRLEDDAHRLENLLADNADKDKVRAELKKISASIKESDEAIKAVRVPKTAEAIQKDYEKAFGYALKRVNATERLLTEGISAEDRDKALQELNELKIKAEETDQDILKARREFADTYREVQLPDVYEPNEKPKNY